MADSQASMEIMDVLSSIRRLVSEDRKVRPEAAAEPAAGIAPEAAEETAAEAPSAAAAGTDGAADAAGLPAAEAPVAAQPAPASRLPGESRFVLTAALRVDDGEDEEEEDGDEAAADPDWDADDVAADAEGTGDTDDAAWFAERARHAVDRDLPGTAAEDDRAASLEETIAELEAAVAGIEADFEPDGGDTSSPPEGLTTLPEWSPAEPAPTRVQFHGIMAGFDSMAAASDDRLDIPVTGDVTLPRGARAEDWRAVPDAGDAGILAARTEAPWTAPARDGGESSAFVHAPAAPPAAADDEATLPESAGDEGGDGEDPGLAAKGADEADDGHRDTAAAWQAPADDPADDIDDAAAETGATEEPDPEPAPRSRPTIVRGGRGDDDLTATGAAADDDDDDADLFDPLAEADVDVDQLRDLVAELVRDELRGALGERITRNLRALVRREIARALDDLPRGGR